MKRAPRSHRRAAFAIALSLGAAALSPSSASADPYRLKADAYGMSAADGLAGLVTLSGQARPWSWADAEVAVWMGAGENRDDHVGDVLVANIRLREPHGYGELRAGRILFTAGAIRPVQIDGATVTGRIPRGPQIQAFGGVPVEPAFGARQYDWAAGGRLSQRFGESGEVGVSFLHRRGQGILQLEELGFDAGFSPGRWLDTAADVAVDLMHSTVSDARLSAALRLGATRLEIFGVRRSPAHLLPATSLFAALGDVASDQGGATLWVRAAPRLDVWATAQVDDIAGELGHRAEIHSTLRLDDRGDRAIGFEIRRQWNPIGASWSGGRGMIRIPIVYGLRVAAEMEIAAPDEAGDRGAVWPWGLLSIGYNPHFLKWLDLAGAVEAGASPTSRAFVSGIARLSATWEKR